MEDLGGKWVLITGASRGIGFQIAKALSDSGCKLILHSRKLEGTLDMVNELISRGVNANAIAADLSSEEEVERFIKDVKELTHDNLDVLYNNAAIMTEYRPMFEPTFEDYKNSFMVNSIVPFKLCDAFLPKMLERNWGRIINVTSGIENQPGLMAYSCSKAALDRYVRDMVPTLEGTNVLMNLMDPGWISTDLGGEKAPNLPESVIPGALVPILIEKDKGSGKLYRAQDYN